MVYVTCDIEAASAEMFLVISSIGVNMLMTLVAMSNCEAESTGIDPSAPYAAIAIFCSTTD